MSTENFPVRYMTRNEAFTIASQAGIWLPAVLWKSRMEDHFASLGLKVVIHPVTKEKQVRRKRGGRNLKAIGTGAAVDCAFGHNGG